MSWYQAETGAPKMGPLRIVKTRQSVENTKFTEANISGKKFEIIVISKEIDYLS
jgi:hypothetical protein